MGGYRYKRISIVYNESEDPAPASILVTANCINDDAPDFDVTRPLTTLNDAESFLIMLWENGWFNASATRSKLGKLIANARNEYTSLTREASIKYECISFKEEDAWKEFHKVVWDAIFEELKNKEDGDYHQAIEAVYREMLVQQKKVVEKGREYKAA